jgi:hypothetical protein
VAVLVLSTAADRSDASAFAGRVARWDPSIPVRLVADGQRVTLWADTPFEVLATRAVDGRLEPSTVTVRAADLLTGLAVSTAERVDPGRSAETAWRARVPPPDGWIEVDRIPAERIAELVRAGTDAARSADQDATGRHGTPSIPATLLDSPVLTVSGAGMELTVPMRVVFALSAMGFVGEGPDEIVRVRATRTWLRVDGRYGAVTRRRLAALPLLV